MAASGWLWLTIVASGIFHGVNPAMGWPLAVAAALMGKGRRGLFAAMGLLATGHLVAIAAVLLPFTALMTFSQYRMHVQIGAALAAVAFGAWLLVYPRHPRWVARIRPAQLALWSCAMATVHGAGLMLLPVLAGICGVAEGSGDFGAGALGNAVAASLVHTTAMVIAGCMVALLVHGWLGMRVLSKGWLNLDVAWASSFLAVGSAMLLVTWVAD